MDQHQAKGRVETLIHSLSPFSESVMLILSGDSEAVADAKKIGPALILERLWQRTGIKDAIKRMLSGRAFKSKKTGGSAKNISRASIALKIYNFKKSIVKDQS